MRLLMVFIAFGFGTCFVLGEKETCEPCEAASFAQLRAEACVPSPLGGSEWIISMRDKDFGWQRDTHRAVIALLLEDWQQFATPQDIQQMELQLEVELTKMLLSNNTSIVPNELALYVHALLAMQKNPRNFHGIDLVANLLDAIDGAKGNVHPFLLLALCNANALTPFHVNLIKYTLQRNHNSEYRALALQAYSCAASFADKFTTNRTAILQAQDELASLQREDGSFGNVYTTSFIVQALATAPSAIKWSREEALKWLRQQSTINPNMVSTYLIQRALHAERVPFIKNMHPSLAVEPPTVKEFKDKYIQYTIKKDIEAYFTITIQVLEESNFFDIMKLSALHDSKFNFSYYTDNKGHPYVYSISDVPNNADENLYWRLCLQSEINHNRHSSNMKTVRAPPTMLTPKQGEHVIFWYKDSDCELY